MQKYYALLHFTHVGGWELNSVVWTSVVALVDKTPGFCPRLSTSLEVSDTVILAFSLNAVELFCHPKLEDT